MRGSQTTPPPAFTPDHLPLGIVSVDRTGTIRSYRPFSNAVVATHDALIGRNFFRDVVPYPQLRRFRETFSAFAAHERAVVEPFEFLFSDSSDPCRITLLFVRDVELDSQIAILVVKNGVLA